MIEDDLQKLMQDALKDTLEESKELSQSLGDSVSRGALRVNTSKLKEFALSNLPEGSRLRDILLSERDEVDPEEFTAKIDVWLKLLRMEYT